MYLLDDESTLSVANPYVGPQYRAILGLIWCEFQDKVKDAFKMLGEAVLFFRTGKISSRQRDYVIFQKVSFLLLLDFFYI